MSNHPDVTLISRMSRGDSGALGIIIERYWPALVRYSRGIVGNHDEAEDVAQEAFARLWERRDAWQVDGSVLPLLLRIAKNRSLDSLRKRSARDRANNGLPLPFSPPTPERVLETDELRTIVTAAVDSLPERRREVLILIRFYGLTRKEVAESLDLAPQTVANHLSLGMKYLRTTLAPYFADSTGCSIEARVDRTA